MAGARTLAGGLRRGLGLGAAAAGAAAARAQRGLGLACRAGAPAGTPEGFGGAVPSGGDGLGDMGARDPFEAELASNFCEKTLGNADTEHVIRIGDKAKHILGLNSMSCRPLPAGTRPLAEEVVERLRMQVPGWAVVVDGEGRAAISREWEAKDFAAGLDIFQRIAAVAEAEGHHPDLHLEGWNKARAVLTTHSIGGLSENDFILANKINELDFADVLKKKKAKFWA